MPQKKVAIGIDLGTTKCCVGVVCGGRAEIIENEGARKTTPSYVAFTGTERLVGENAKDQAALNPANTVFGVKRLLGRQFDDAAVQEQVPRRLPFGVDKNERGKPSIGVKYKHASKTLFPEQVSAMLLAKMRKLVQTRFDCPVKEAVISVPASFTNAQRQATKDAAAIAGLKVLALINEPTAAAIAYQVNRKEEAEENIAVVDFGGGKLEASIITVKKHSVEVKAVFGYTNFGGSDIDNLIIDLLIKKFHNRTGIDVSSNIKAKERLRSACERLKHTLSLLPETRVHLDCLSGDSDLNEIITRNEFEETVGSKTRDRLDQIYRALSSYVKERVLGFTKVLLVGGSTRIPLVQRWLEERFGRALLDKTVNPDEAVAQGAAVQAALLGGDNAVTELHVCEVPWHAITLDQDGKRSTVFDKFEPIPSTKNFYPARVWLRSSEFRICESINLDTAELLQSLVTFKLDCVRLSSLKFDFLMDRSGIFSVSQMSNGNERKLNTLIQETLRLFPESSMNEMTKVEKEFERDTLKEHNRISALSELESYCFREKNKLEKLFERKQISSHTFRDLSQRIESMIAWIDSSPSEPESSYVQQQLELKKACDEFLPKDESALSRRLSSKRSSSANVSTVTESCGDPPDGEGVQSPRQSRRDQAGGDDSKSRTRRCVSHSARCAVKGKAEDPSGAAKVDGTCDRESRRGRKEKEDHSPKRMSSRGENDGQMRSGSRRDGSSGDRAKHSPCESKTAPNELGEERATKNVSNHKMEEGVRVGLSNRNQLVEHVGPPKIKPSLLPSGGYNTRSKHSCPRDQFDGDHRAPAQSPRGPPSQTHEVAAKSKIRSRELIEIESTPVCYNSEERCVTTGNQKPTEINDPKSGLNWNRTGQAAMMERTTPGTEDTENEPFVSSETSNSTGASSSSDDPNICYGVATKRTYTTRSLGVQTIFSHVQRVEAKLPNLLQDQLAITADELSKAGDVCPDCQLRLSCGCTIADSLGPINGVVSTLDSGIEEIEPPDSRYNPSKYATRSKTKTAGDSLRKIPSSGGTSHENSRGIEKTPHTLRGSGNDSPLTTADERRRRQETDLYRATPTPASPSRSPTRGDRSSDTKFTVGRSDHAKLNPDTAYTRNESDPRMGSRSGVGMEAKYGIGSHASTRMKSDPARGSRVNTKLHGDASMSSSPSNTSLNRDYVKGSDSHQLSAPGSPILTRSKSRGQEHVFKGYTPSIDRNCVCGSCKEFCSDCYSARLIKEGSSGKASGVPSSSVLIRDVLTGTTGSLSSLNIRSQNSFFDELLKNCSCGSGKFAAICCSKDLPFGSATPPNVEKCAKGFDHHGSSSAAPHTSSSSDYQSSSARELERSVPETSAVTDIDYFCICDEKRSKCYDCHFTRLRRRRQHRALQSQRHYPSGRSISSSRPWRY